MVVLKESVAAITVAVGHKELCQAYHLRPSFTKPFFTFGPFDQVTCFSSFHLLSASWTDPYFLTWGLHCQLVPLLPLIVHLTFVLSYELATLVTLELDLGSF